MSITEPEFSPRIPKILVRNRAPEQPCPDGERQPSVAGSDTTSRPIQPTRHVTSSERAEDSSRPASWNSKQPEHAPPKGSKKKRTNIFGFLSVKEPSAKALEHFAEQQRLQAEAKGQRLIVPASQLPASVPKVNSKWDGLPNGVKEAAKQKEQTSAIHRMASARRPNSNRNSITTLGSAGSNRYSTSFASGSTRFGTAGSSSSASGGSDRIPTATSASSACNTSQWRDARSAKTLSTASLPEIACYLNLDTPQQEMDSSGSMAGTGDDISLLTSSSQQQAQSVKAASIITSRSYDLGDNVAPLAPFFTESVHPDDETPRISQNPSPRTISMPFNAPGFLAGEAQEIQLQDESDDDDTALRGSKTRDSLTGTEAPSRSSPQMLSPESAYTISLASRPAQGISLSTSPSVSAKTLSPSNPQPSKDMAVLRNKVNKSEVLPWDDVPPPPEPIARTTVAESENPKKPKGRRSLFGR